MPTAMLDERQLNFRVFLQPYGANPGNQPRFFNHDAKLVRGSGMSPSISETNAQVGPSDRYYGENEIIGGTKGEPDRGSITLEQNVNMKHINILEQCAKYYGAVGIQILGYPGKAEIGDSNKWTKKWVISSADVSSLGYGDFMGQGSDDVVTISSEYKFNEYAVMVALKWAELIASTVATPVNGVAFGEYFDELYLFAAGDGATTAPKFIYKPHRSATWTTVTMTVLTNSEHPNDLIRLGDTFIAPTEADSYVWADKSNLAAAGWVEVTSGFTVSKTPNAVWGLSTAQVFFAADGGYIYEMSGRGQAVTALESGVTTTEDLVDIDGLGSVVVAVGTNNAVMVSTNSGETWDLITGPSVGNDLTCVQVVSDDIWHIGADDGYIYYTLNGGDTWGTGTFSGAGAGSVTALEFDKDNPAFGLLAHKTASPAAVVFATTDGGASWEQTNYTNFPTSQEVNRFAIFDPINLLAGGIATGGTDGCFARATDLTDY